MKRWSIQASRKFLYLLPMALVAGLVALALVLGNRPLPAKPDAHHVSMVLAKQDAWLEKHPLLLKISRSQIAGVPGDLLTSTCWHLMGVMKPHSRGAERPVQMWATTNGARRG